MTTILHYACAALLLVSLPACTARNAMTANEPESVDVYRGTKDVRPERRTLVKVGTLSPSGAQALERFVREAKTQRFSFVLSTYYLDVIGENGSVQKRYGVVINADGRFGGLDITTRDPAKTSVTSLHTLLVSRDSTSGTALLEAIKLLEEGK
jgi:hypothetical protein